MSDLNSSKITNRINSSPAIKNDFKIYTKKENSSYEQNNNKEHEKHIKLFEFHQPNHKKSKIILFNLVNCISLHIKF